MKIFGTHDENTVKQLQNCVDAEPGARGVLCADGHLGYSMPIGGVVAYEKSVSPSGVGYDIACGNMAVRTNLSAVDVQGDLERLGDEIQARISFGVGRNNNEPVDDPVFDRIASSAIPQQRGLLQLAKNQLGTVGSGNHYVDVLVDSNGCVWVACHFGSRGFGHKTASMFMNVAQGLSMDAKSHDGEMMSPPLLFHTDNPIGQDYIEAMTIAGEYAYAGRRHVVQKTLDILGAQALETVHNHHNFAWKERHFGTDYWVVRKGATPAGPGVRGFIGGSMGDVCVIVRGCENEDAQQALYSTVHGAGRLMSRTQAIKGKHEWVCSSEECETHDFVQLPRVPPADLKCPRCRSLLTKRQVSAPIDFAAVQADVKKFGTVLRGAGADEAPQVYRHLWDVLDAHRRTIEIEVMMYPLIVVMAGKEVADPYKD